MLAALQFLTILPVPSGAASPARGAWAFPLVGAMLGLAAVPLLALPLGPALALLLLCVLTGGLHEDGLADVCDAVRGYRPRERMLAILKDSRIGAHGALALLFSVLLRWQALAHLQGNPWLRLPAAIGISRASMVLLAAWSKPAGEGLGSAFAAGLPRYAVWLAAIQCLLLAALAQWPAGAILAAANLLGIALCRAWFERRLGGVTGDCLGFQCQLSEAISLVVLAWV
jgi:adenosylcobinamide-GDP ribazoletransferase